MEESLTVYGNIRYLGSFSCKCQFDTIFVCNWINIKCLNQFCDVHRNVSWRLDATINLQNHSQLKTASLETRKEFHVHDLTKRLIF